MMQAEYHIIYIYSDIHLHTMMYCMLVAGVVVMSPFRMVFGGNDVPSHLKKKQDIRQVVVQADVITYNAIISACEKASAWEEALSLLAEISRCFVSISNVVSI